MGDMVQFGKDPRRVSLAPPWLGDTVPKGEVSAQRRDTENGEHTPALLWVVTLLMNKPGLLRSGEKPSQQ